MNSLHHIAIICSNKEQSMNFYKTLGFEILREYPRPERNDEIIFLLGYGVILEIFVRSDCPKRVTDPEAYGLRHIALSVDDIDAICKKLEKAGYMPEKIRTDSITGEKMTFVKDPDGLPIELHE